MRSFPSYFIGRVRSQGAPLQLIVWLPLGSWSLRNADSAEPPKNQLHTLWRSVQLCLPIFDNPRHPFFGPNFAQLGIAETPFDTIHEKLQVSQPADLQVHAWCIPGPAVQHLWTDGSVQLSNHPWLTVASYAV